MNSNSGTRLVRKLAAGAISAVLLMACGAVQLGTASADTGIQPLIHYPFDTAADDGIVRNTGTAEDSDGVISGSAAIENGRIILTGSQYVTVPTAALAGSSDVTVSMWLKNNYGSGNTAAAYIGNASTSKGYFLLNPSNPSNYLKSVMTGATAANPSSSPWSTETGPGSTAAPTSGTRSTAALALYTTVIDGSSGKMSVYLNGKQVGSSEYAIAEGGLTNYKDLVAYIGKSSYPDPNTKIDVDDYAVYGSALSADAISDLYSSQVFDKAISGVELPTTVTADFTLPTTSAGTTIAWSSDNSAISITGGKATVTRPDSQHSDQQVTLTATFSVDGLSQSKEYTLTVPRGLSDAERVQQDLAAIAIANADDMRTNFSVPTSGANGSLITWNVVDGGEASPSITEGVNDSSRTVTVFRPAAGKDATQLVLRATATLGDVTTSKDFTVTIQAMPTDESADEAYVWAFFTGEGVGGEKISLSASKGNDALDWNTLNAGTPLFTSSQGEQGLRDPFIFKSKDGDKFYMIATDLKIAGRPNSAGGLSGFAGAQADGSKYIEIWESDDLVTWSDQRHVKVSSEYAGNTWAPEAYYDEELGKYVVYWASNLYDTTDTAARTSLTYNRMMYVTSDDFVNFSEAKIWIDVDRRGQSGAGSIDATVQQENGTYYRIYKDENSMTLRQEKSTNLLATITGSYPTSGLASDQWSLMGERIGYGQSNGYGGTFSAGEGPSLFKANADDVNGYQYYLFADQPNYHGGPNHYVPLATEDISDASAWTVIGNEMPEGNFPTNSDGGMPRHGTVLPVTRAQYQRVLEAYAPNIAVASVQAVSLSTTVGTDPTASLPDTVTLTKADDSQASAGVSWDQIDAASYAQAGSFEVRGVADDDSRMPVSATVTVLPVDTGLSDEVRLKSLRVSDTEVSIPDLEAGKAVVRIADPSTVTKADVHASAVDPAATVEISLADHVITIAVTSSDASRHAIYTVTLQKSSGETPSPGGDDDSNAAVPSDGKQGGNSQDGGQQHTALSGKLPSTGSTVSAIVILAILVTSLGATALARSHMRRDSADQHIR